MSGSPRAGIGYDSHRFAESGGRLVLGGVELPGEPGLAGHSDADVVSHARDRRRARRGWARATSATHFPDDDRAARTRTASSCSAGPAMLADERLADRRTST